MRTSDFDYELPKKYIAQEPIEPRDAAKLMVYDRQTDKLFHRYFRDLPEFLTPGDVLVVNKTKVYPARLHGRKANTGGKVEVLLLKQVDDLTWHVMVGGSGLNKGKKIEFPYGISAIVSETLEGSERLLQFNRNIKDDLGLLGEMPVPPYITKPLTNQSRYQTVYASDDGSAAAPTAGLHFTQALLEKIKDMGVIVSSVILHVGLDTFAPVKEENPVNHKMHTEWCVVPDNTAHEINLAVKEGRRVIAVGTTSVRALETAAQHCDMGVIPYSGKTGLYIIPGYKFRVVNSIITNFHLPRSTLIMMISAFMGRDKLLSLYEIAKEKNYRFYSFGDAMLIL